MTKHTLPWILLLIAVMVISLQCQREPKTITNTVTEIDTLVVVDTVRTTIYRDRVITVIDTIIVDGHEYTVARYKETIDTLNVRVALDIEYWEQERYFNVRSDVSAETSTVYITETIANTIEKPYPLMSAIAGISPAFSFSEDKVNVHSFMLDAGVRLAGKYDISAFGSTDGTYGIRAGIKF